MLSHKSHVAGPGVAKGGTTHNIDFFFAFAGAGNPCGNGHWRLSLVWWQDLGLGLKSWALSLG